MRPRLACGGAFFGGNVLACTGCALRPSLAVPGGVANSATKGVGAPGRSSGTCEGMCACACHKHVFVHVACTASQGTLTLTLTLPLPLPLTPIMTGCQVDAQGESPLKAVAPKLFTLTFGERSPSPYP